MLMCLKTVLRVAKSMVLDQMPSAASDLSQHCLVRHVCFVCVEVLWPSQLNGVMSSAVNLSNHIFTGQA